MFGALVPPVLAAMALVMTVVPATAQLSSDATLSALVVQAHNDSRLLPLDPHFSPATTYYDVDATAAVGIKVTPTANDARATIDVEGVPVASGTTSSSLYTMTGPNIFQITVTAEDGITSQIYTLETLALPSLRPGALTSGIVGQSYAIRAGADTQGLAPGSQLPPGLLFQSAGARKTIEGTPSQAGTFAFSLAFDGANGTTVYYDYTLEILPHPDTLLSGLSLSEGTLAPAFTSTGTLYSATVPFATQAIALTPLAANPAATITVNGIPVISGGVSAPVPLAPGNNTIAVVVEAPLGGYVETYTVMVARGPALDEASIGHDVESFVQGRMNMLASAIGVPGLRDRRAGRGGFSSTLSPTQSGLALGFAASLAPLEAFRDFDTQAPETSPFNIWVNGTLKVHNRTDNGALWGLFGLASGGFDYLLSEHVLAGVSFHIDHLSDPLANGTTITGQGWLAGPYASFEIGEGVFFDASLLYGGSSNRISAPTLNGSFDTERWVGEISVSGEWALDEATLLSPNLRAVYISESAPAYSASNGVATITMPGFTKEQLRVSAGADISRRFELESGLVLTPRAGLAVGFSGLGGSGAFGTLTTGFSLTDANDWTFASEGRLDVGAGGEISAGVRAGLNVSF